MENIINQRIRKIIKTKEISITALSKIIEMPQVTLNRQISGESTMSVNTIFSILNYFPDISAEWLLRGEGEMIKPSTPSHLTSSTKELTIYIDGNGFLKAK